MKQFHITPFYLTSQKKPGRSKALTCILFIDTINGVTIQKMLSNKNDALIKSLQNPELYSHEVNYFKIIETHISWVLLTGCYAYKIKKPLNLGFLDFSTLEKRRHFCYEELRLNSRLTTDLYLDVVAITGTEKQPTFVNMGPPIEYAVKMRQFDPDKTFDQLLSEKLLTKEHAKQTAAIIAAFHSKIAIATNDTEFGSADALMQPVRDNFSQILQLKTIGKSDDLNHLTVWSEQQHIALMSFFKQRKQAGFIRECHGDLHLRNIALINGQIVPFDGIEFNPSLYWIDVISEIAFLVMDLQDKKRQDLAFQFLNQYLQDSGDYSGLKILRFYLVYRAIVMAKVSAIRASQRVSAEDRLQDISRYQGYLQLANSYTQSSTPILIIMHGVSGSGKSWLSEKIIERYQAIRLRSDVERKRLHKLSPQQPSVSGINNNLYSQASSDKTYQSLLQLAVEILDAGYNVIVDATFLQHKHRMMFSQQANQLQVPFLIINTLANKQTLLHRIKDRANQPDNVSEANQTVLENQLDSIQVLSDEEIKSSIAIDSKQNTQLSKLWKLLDVRIHS